MSNRSQLGNSSLDLTEGIVSCSNGSHGCWFITGVSLSRVPARPDRFCKIIIYYCWKSPWWGEMKLNTLIKTYSKSLIMPPGQYTQTLPVYAICGHWCGLHMTATTATPLAVRTGLVLRNGHSLVRYSL